MIAFLLLIIGGLNWGLLGLTGWEIGHLFGGMDAVISKIIYILVGLSALVILLTHKGSCKMCMNKNGMGKNMDMGGQKMEGGMM